MNTGAIVMLDALGFKGIWERHAESAVLDKMKMLRHDTAALSEGKILSITKEVQYGASVLSDTIIIWAYPSDELKRATNIELINFLSLFVASYSASLLMLRAGLDQKPHLCFRGCATIGGFLIDGTTVLGPAIDEAASNHSKAKAGLAWLTPHSLTLLDRVRRNDRVNQQTKSAAELMFVHGYPVPFHGGETYRTSVINPFCGPKTDESLVQTFRTNLIASFDTPVLEVQMKRQHTESFLSTAELTWREHLKKLKAP